jgi:uncharacterized coiled-coil protein SlyX
MPTISPSHPPPRFVSLLVEGDGVLGAGVKQRVVVDRDAVLPHLTRDEESLTETQRVRAAMEALLAIFEAQLAPPAGTDGGAVRLPIDQTDVFIFDDGAGDFVPLNSPANLIDLARVRVRVRAVRPGTARAARPVPSGVRELGDEPPRSKSSLGNGQGRHDDEDHTARDSAPPLTIRTVVAFTAAVLRNVAANGADSVDIRALAELWVQRGASGELDEAGGMPQDEDLIAGGLPAVADVLVASLAEVRERARGDDEGRAQHGVGMEEELAEARKKAASLEAALAEQQQVVTMLQNALFETRDIVEQVTAASSAARNNVPSADHTPAPSVMPADAGDDARAPPASLAHPRRVVLYYYGRTVERVPSGAKAAAAEAAGRRSRVVHLAPGEPVTIELLNRQAAIGFGRAEVPYRRGDGNSSGGEPLAVGCTRRSDNARTDAPAYAFRSDEDLQEYVARQHNPDGLPVVPVFPIRAFVDGSVEGDDGEAPEPEEQRRAEVTPLPQLSQSGDNTPPLASVDGAGVTVTPPAVDSADTSFHPPPLREGPGGAEMPMLASNSTDNLPVTSPFVRPESALGYGSASVDFSPRGTALLSPPNGAHDGSSQPLHRGERPMVVLPHQPRTPLMPIDMHAPVGGDRPASAPRQPRPPSSAGGSPHNSRPAAARTSRTPTSDNGNGGTHGVLVLVPQQPPQESPPASAHATPRRASSVAGVREASLVSSAALIDDVTITGAFDELRSIDPTDDGAVAVDLVLAYLEDTYETIGDPHRFIRLLPDRCVEHFTGRPRSASAHSRRARAAGLAPDRLSKDDFAVMLLKIAKS